MVVRVSDEIRSSIKANRDKIFLGMSSHKVFDRFYVKQCSKCHGFGHYHANCPSSAFCGYCSADDHESRSCPIKQAKNFSQFRCRNCATAGKESEGHSSHWSKCPSFVEQQNKVRESIPYY